MVTDALVELTEVVRVVTIDAPIQLNSIVGGFINPPPSSERIDLERVKEKNPGQSGRSEIEQEIADCFSIEETCALSTQTLTFKSRFYNAVGLLQHRNRRGKGYLDRYWNSKHVIVHGCFYFRRNAIQWIKSAYPATTLNFVGRNTTNSMSVYKHKKNTQEYIPIHSDKTDYDE